MRKDAILAIVAAAAGIAGWILAMKLGHRREAWDSPLYWSVAMPMMWVTTAVLAWIGPRRAWRWAVIPFAAQFTWMIATQGAGGLWPLGLALFAILSLPSLAIAIVIGARRVKSISPPD